MIKEYLLNSFMHITLLGGRSQTTLTRFLAYLTTYPHKLTFSMVWTLIKSEHFCTTYLPCLVNVICERPLTLRLRVLSYQVNFEFQSQCLMGKRCSCKNKDDFDTYRWNLCPSCKVGNLLLFSDSAPIDKFYFTPIDMLCYW